MFYTYILKSLKSGRYYIGYTANLNKRLNEHNSGRVMTTKREYPWILFYYEKFSFVCRDSKGGQKEFWERI